METRHVLRMHIFDVSCNIKVHDLVSGSSWITWIREFPMLLILLGDGNPSCSQSLKPPLDNSCAMLRILMMVDSRRTQLSEQSIIKLSKIPFGCLTEIAACFLEEDDKCTISNSILSYRYYLLSLAINFDPIPTSHYYSQMTNDHSRKIMAVASVNLMISKDVKVQKVLSSCKAEINSILHSIHSLQKKKKKEEREEREHAGDEREKTRSRLLGPFPIWS